MRNGHLQELSRVPFSSFFLYTIGGLHQRQRNLPLHPVRVLGVPCWFEFFFKGGFVCFVGGGGCFLR